MARPSRGWVSTDRASASASMAELSSSATSTRMTEAIRMKTSSVVRPRKNAAGTSRMARTSSWRNAASYLMAAFSPCSE
ncbi:Uncharacterised protein [Bordetella pertussis]|nr:Uncharacterised protein [Bordetella pertussis]